MSRIVRRDMLKVMAATAAGVAVSGIGIESVLAASPSPGGGTVHGTKPGLAATGRPNIFGGGPTPFTTYQSFPGADFEAGASTLTWVVSGPEKSATNGGFYFRPLQLPDKAVITECVFFFLNPTTSVSCFVLSSVLGSGTLHTIGSGTGAPSSTLQTVALTVTPTPVDNVSSWYDLDFETLGANDDQIWGARIGWIHNPGLTLFPNPRRIVNGDTTPFVSGATYGPFDARLESDGATPTGIPLGATAAFCAVQSYTPGVLTIFPDGTTDPGLANYSGTGNLGFSLNMVYMMVPLSALAKFKIHSYITGRCFVDAWGYVI